MLYVNAEPLIGMNHEEWAAEAITLANRLGCGVHVLANQVNVAVHPKDTVREVISMYRMLADMKAKGHA